MYSCIHIILTYSKLAGVFANCQVKYILENQTNGTLVHSLFTSVIYASCVTEISFVFQSVYIQKLHLEMKLLNEISTEMETD